ncbi:hypothetical protein TNCV_5731 [Trichonephila clavipes]|nr:hypothetical protein TNCV_5731 [Trichonephila clavipes]
MGVSNSKATLGQTKQGLTLNGPSKKNPYLRKRGISAETDEIGNVIEEVVDLARQINLGVDSDDVQELLNSHNQELAIDAMQEQSNARARP